MIRATKREWTAITAAALLVGATLLASYSPAYAGVRVEHTDAYGDVLVSTSRAQGSGQLSDTVVSVTNHVVRKHATRDADATPREYLLVWAGDENIADTAVSDIEELPDSLAGPVGKTRDALPGQDFLAVVDATEGSSAYGEVVNTATVSPLVENEPHHMQYTWHKGDTVFAGGLFSATTYAFDVSALPYIKLKGASLPTDTLGGSVPDAYWMLDDGTTYATYMGGPVLPGPHLYSDGSVHSGNGFAGSPGEVVRFDRNGKVLGQHPAATPGGDDSDVCEDLPGSGEPTCANPHGIQAREDLDTMVTADYVEPRNIILDPLEPLSPYLYRSTVRTWDISDPARPTVESVSYLPAGPDEDTRDPQYRDSSAVMETTVTQRHGHKGAFVQTMQGGAIYYAPDITAPKPDWRKVWDDGDALTKFNPDSGSDAAATNGGWIQTSANDHYLYHTIMGRHRGTLDSDDPGAPGGVIALDISKLVDESEPDCDLHTGSRADDCPELTGATGINPDEPGMGPHFGTSDNFDLGADGKYHETDQPKRIAATDYFIARSGHDGDHRVWMLNTGDDGELSLDRDFRDEFTGEVGLDFNRDAWPHGRTGNAKPHLGLLVVGDDDVK